MELRKHLSLKIVSISIYFVSLFIYILVGFMPADAAQTPVYTRLSIPAINLSTEVETLALDNGRLNTPDEIAGSFSLHPRKTLLIGHSSTIFAKLDRISIDDKIRYNHQTYHVTNIKTLLKTEISMNELLRDATKDTIVLMTCAGQDLGGGDATHRLLVTGEVE